MKAGLNQSIREMDDGEGSVDGFIRYTHGMRDSLDPNSARDPSQLSKEQSLVRFTDNDEDYTDYYDDPELAVSAKSRYIQSGSTDGPCMECGKGRGMHESWCPIPRDRSMRTNQSSNTRMPRENSRNPFSGTVTGKSSPDPRLGPARDVVINGTFDLPNRLNARGTSNTRPSDLRSMVPLEGQFGATDIQGAGNTAAKQRKDSELDKDNTITVFPGASKQAYLKALMYANDKRRPLKPWMMSQRISRAFVFSYYPSCPSSTGTPDTTANMSVSIPLGKEMKHIFNEFDVNDFFPGGQYNVITEQSMSNAITRKVPKEIEPNPRFRSKKEKGKSKGDKMQSVVERSDTSASVMSDTNKFLMTSS